MANILKLILERVEYEALINEGRDPVEVLKYKYQDVPVNIIDKVVDIDPTKKKSYSQWLLSHWDDEKKTIVDGLKDGRIEKLFQHYKQHNDIQIKDCPSVEEGLVKYVPNEDTVLTKSHEPTTTLMNNGWVEEVDSSLANDFDIVFNEDDWIIAVPNTYEADCKLGENMYWCTAGGRSSFNGGRSYFDSYLNNYGGRYYVNFDMSRGESRLGKDYPFKRYQFHFESKQFMDKDDEPVELLDIDMPQSAMDFYENEGYDSENFQDMETRLERYDAQRYEHSYHINDDLYLCFEYDEDLEFIEPDADTDFYLFSVDDDRDPISFVSLPNPFTNDVVVVNDNNLCVFKTKYGIEGVLAAVSKKNQNGWYSRWDTCEFDKYLVLPDNIGVFGWNQNGFFEVLTSSKGLDKFNENHINELETMFVNEQCTEADANEGLERVFIEAVGDGYHSLFAISPNGKYNNDIIVYKDVPKDGESFKVNEKYIIEGEFRNYRIYGDDRYEPDESYMSYDMEAKLQTGDYLVWVGDGKLNILKPNNNTPLLQEPFDKFMGYGANMYCVQTGKGLAFYSVNGNLIGSGYSTFLAIDKEHGIVAGIGKDHTESTDIINGLKSRIIASFKAIVSRKPFNNKIVVVDNDDSRKAFDYVNETFSLSQLGSFMPLFQSKHPNMFMCSMGDDNVIFDMDKEMIVLDGISYLEAAGAYNEDVLKVSKKNGKQNLFGLSNEAELLPYDVDKVTNYNGYINVVIFINNGRRYYIYDYVKKQFLINPNGTDIPVTNNGGESLTFIDGNNKIAFSPSSNGDYVFSFWQGYVDKYGGGRMVLDCGYKLDGMPQDLIDMYCRITGAQQPSQQEMQQQEEPSMSVREEFLRFMNRIDETRNKK